MPLPRKPSPSRQRPPTSALPPAASATPPNLTHAHAAPRPRTTVPQPPIPALNAPQARQQQQQPGRFAWPPGHATHPSPALSKPPALHQPVRTAWPAAKGVLPSPAPTPLPPPHAPTRAGWPPTEGAKASPSPAPLPPSHAPTRAAWPSAEGAHPSPALSAPQALQQQPPGIAAWPPAEGRRAHASRGYAFVNFSDPRALAAAAEALQGRTVLWPPRQAQAPAAPAEARDGRVITLASPPQAAAAAAEAADGRTILWTPQQPQGPAEAPEGHAVRWPPQQAQAPAAPAAGHAVLWPPQQPQAPAAAAEAPEGRAVLWPPLHQPAVAVAAPEEPAEAALEGRAVLALPALQQPAAAGESQGGDVARRAGGVHAEYALHQGREALLVAAKAPLDPNHRHLPLGMILRPPPPPLPPPQQQPQRHQQQQQQQEHGASGGPAATVAPTGPPPSLEGQVQAQLLSSFFGAGASAGGRGARAAAPDGPASDAPVPPATVLPIPAAAAARRASAPPSPLPLPELLQLCSALERDRYLHPALFRHAQQSLWACLRQHAPEPSPPSPDAVLRALRSLAGYAEATATELGEQRLRRQACLRLGERAGRLVWQPPPPPGEALVAEAALHAEAALRLPNRLLTDAQPPERGAAGAGEPQPGSEGPAPGPHAVTPPPPPLLDPPFLAACAAWLAPRLPDAAAQEGNAAAAQAAHALVRVAAACEAWERCLSLDAADDAADDGAVLQQQQPAHTRVVAAIGDAAAASSSDLTPGQDQTVAAGSGVLGTLGAALRPLCAAAARLAMQLHPGAGAAPCPPTPPSTFSVAQPWVAGGGLGLHTLVDLAWSVHKLGLPSPQL